METESLPSFFGTENLDTVKGWKEYPPGPPKGHAEPPWDFFMEAVNLMLDRYPGVDPWPGKDFFREFLETFFVTPWEEWVGGYERFKNLPRYTRRGVQEDWATLVHHLASKNRSVVYLWSEKIRDERLSRLNRDEVDTAIGRARPVVRKKEPIETRVVLKTIIKEIKRRRWPESYEDILMAAWDDPKKMKKKKGRRVFAGGDEKLSELSGWSFMTVKRARWAFMKAGIWNIQRRWSWQRKRCYELLMCRSMSQVMHFKKKAIATGKTIH